MMNITVGRYRIVREATGETFIYKDIEQASERGSGSKGTLIPNPPNSSELAGGDYNVILTNIEIAFKTGRWPTSTICPCCGK